MERGSFRHGGQGNVFKGSQLVTSILQRYPGTLQDRKSALQFCRQLFKEGTIRGVFDVNSFEDSVLLYTWNDQHEPQNKPPQQRMTSQSYMKSRGTYGYSSADTRVTKRDLYQQGSIKPVTEQTTQRQNFQNFNHLPTDSYFVGNVQVQNSLDADNASRKSSSHLQTSPNYKRASTASRSSESSVEIASRSHSRHKDRNHQTKPPLGFSAMTLPHDHDVIPEEVVEEHHVPLMERTGTSTEYDGSSSIPRSVTTDASNYNDIDQPAHQRPWTDYQNSYSDNEKQLIEQMKRMKKEHSHILRTYEDRINKLMNKMHELRNIAQMLENSSTKSSPYGMLQSKPTGYNSSATRPDQSDRKPGMFYGSDGEHPPPLPPRPGRGSRVIPNKPLITPGTRLKTLDWNRIILRDKSTDDNPTIWHTVQEPTIDSEEIERLFSNPELSDTDGATLYDDLIIRRGRSRQQLVSIYDTERSKRIVICMKCLRATLTDVISTVSSLDTSQINHEGLAELFEFLSSSTHIEKTLHYVRKKGAGQLDHPEYLVFELSKVDHFTDRLEFIRFRYKTQWHLFEIEQQLRELNIACNELTNSISLKNLMETLLAVGNYLNGNTDLGQADGYDLDALNRLKDTQEKDGKGSLLEFVLKTYCQIYESEVDIGCPTRFRLPEPSNMRHAAQVSFEGIQDALTNLLSDLKSAREKLLDKKARKDAIRPTDSFRVTAENFFAAALEVIGSQEKVLQDVRDVFLRTARYFLVESVDVTPQQFFHIFAIFLHDCKYFWKLAHRRLAKERFELEFKFKGQLSAVDLHGYGSFRAGVTEGIYSSRLTDPKTSTLTRDEKINKGLTETTPVVPPKPAHLEMRKLTNSTDHLDHSPKPLTSTPPSSEKLYKPLPKTPQTSANHNHNPTPPKLQTPNYENQSDLNKYYPEQPRNIHGQHANNTNRNGLGTLENTPTTRDNEKDKKNQQFTLKAWLKKEREQVKREIESDSNTENTSVSPSTKKSNNSSRSFSKLKNSMIQKFSGGNSNKRDASSKDKKSTKDKRTVEYPEPIIERMDMSTVNNQFNSPVGYYPTENMQNSPLQNVQYNSPQGSQYDPHQNPQFNHQQSIHVKSPYHRTQPTNTSYNTPYNPQKDEGMHAKQFMLNKNDNSYSVQITQLQSSPFNQYKYTSPLNQYLTDRDYDYNLSNPSNPDVVISPIDDLDQEDVQDNSNQTGGANRPDNRDTQHKTSRSDTNKEDVVNTKASNSMPEPAQVQRTSSDNIRNRLFVPQHNTPTKLSHVTPTVHRTPTSSTSANNYENQVLYPTQKDRSSYNNKDNVNEISHFVDGMEQFSQTSTNDLLVNTPKHSRHGKTNKQSPYDKRVTNRHRPQSGIDNETSVSNDFQTNSSRLDNGQFFTPGTREPMHIQSIGSLTDKFNAMNYNEKPDGVKHMDAIQENTGVNPIAQPDMSEASPPLPPRTYTTSEELTSTRPVEVLKQESEAPNSYIPDYDRYNPSHFSSPQTHLSKFNSPQPFSRQTRSESNIRPAPPLKYPKPSNHNTQAYQYNTPIANGGIGNHDVNKYGGGKSHGEPEERDEGYRAQLRRAANINPSAFTGYGSLKPTLPHSGRASLGPSYQTPTSTAVVKPTVVNSHDVSYMAF